ncbi:uromodulin-like 1 [Hyla sarda]|uniref:uromodulin-like 1 n=1 Tax=Hyla sarda TaxID=327740 RepID=UPI0024C26058|nr:uromodulin-like 1 [Hyla sarda]
MWRMDEKTLLHLTLLWMAAGLGSGQMMGHMISPWSYHVCNHTVILNVSKVVAYQQPREEQTWCLSWIPWKLCRKTSYHTQYRTVHVPETSVVVGCCEGYEPVGHYCALSLRKSGAYISRPGICPVIEDKERGPNCTSDYDCPGLQKCCVSSNGSFCASPAPPALDRNTIKYWYNGTVVIKMGYEELIKRDEGFINHTRLLLSMVKGELWPLEAAVYHLSTQPAGTFSIVSSILLGIADSLPLMDIAATLNNIVIRIPEVISIELHDLNECLCPVLGSCPPYQDCINVEGSYNCTNKSHTDSIQETTAYPAPVGSGANVSRPGICHITEDKERGPNCTSDYDCPGLQKCCVSSNGSFCASPAPPAPVGSGANVSRPGICHIIEDKERGPNCTSDYDCPGLQKCCVSSNGSFCASPAPPAPVGSGANVSRPGICHIIEDKERGPNCTSDYDCPGLQKCCVSSNGSFCASPAPPGPIPHPGPSDPPLWSIPIPRSVTYDAATPTPCNCSMFHNHSVTNVTSSSFYIHWNTDCPDNYTYNVQVSSKDLHLSKTIRGTKTGIDGLQSGEIYTVQVTFQDCIGSVQLWNGKVKTEAEILNATLKIKNWNLTESLQDPNSTDYADFIQKFILEVKNSLSNKIPPERLAVEVESLSAGSIIVHFRIIINDSEHPANLTAASFSAFSPEFQVDPESIVVTDFDECLTPADNDCHLYADCRNLVGSYTCECRPSYVDRDPSRPGRNCEGGEPTSASPDYFGFEQVHQVSTPTASADPTTGGSATSPVETSPPTTSPHLGHLTNAKETTPGYQEGSSTTSPLSSSAEGSVGPSPDQSIVSTSIPAGHPTLGPVNSTLPTPVPTTSHHTAATNSTPSVIDTTAKANASGISAVTQVKTVPPSTSDKGIVTVIPMTTRTTSRGISCSLPIMGVNVGSTSIPPLSPLSVLKITQKPPSLTLKDASTVMCVMGKIGIFMEKAYLNMMSIDTHSLFLGSPECSENCSNDTHIFIEAGWKNCYTHVQTNKTHTVVNSTLYVNISSTFQNFPPKAISYIRCVFHNEILLTSGYNPAGGLYTVIEKLDADGTFLPEFQLFIGDQPIPPNFTLSATDEITVQIRIKPVENQYKVVIDDCWATPTENSNDPISFPFIKESCALPNTFTTIHTNGISSNATFQTKIFSFVENPIVYMHCRLHVCREEPPKTCKPTCNGLRSAMTGDSVFTGVTRMGPLRRVGQSNDQDSSSKGTLGPGYIALIVIGVLALVAMVVSILVCWHERRTGNYNFKIKTQDVGYQVFSN